MLIVIYRIYDKFKVRAEKSAELGLIFWTMRPLDWAEPSFPLTPLSIRNIKSSCHNMSNHLPPRSWLAKR